MDKFDTLTVVELKEKLKGLSLKTSGKKSDLIKRLKEVQDKSTEEISYNFKINIVNIDWIKNMTYKKIAYTIAVLFISWKFFSHGLKALMVAEKFKPLADVILPTEVVPVGLVMIGIIDISIAILLLVRNRPWVLAYAAIYPLVPLSLKFIATGELEVLSKFMIASFATLALLTAPNEGDFLKLIFSKLREFPKLLENPQLLLTSKVSIVSILVLGTSTWVALVPPAFLTNIFEDEPNYTLIEFDSSRARGFAEGLISLGNPGRLSGTGQEGDTASMLQNNFTEAGLTASLEAFSVPMFEIMNEPILSICIPGNYFGFNANPCGPLDGTAIITEYTHHVDFVLQGYSGTRTIGYEDNAAISDLGDGSDTALWSSAEGTIGFVYGPGGSSGNTDLFNKASQYGIIALIVVATNSGSDTPGDISDDPGNCKIPGTDRCVPFFKTVIVNELSAIPTDIPFMMVSDVVANEITEAFAAKDTNDVRIRISTDVENDGERDIRVPCGTLQGQSDKVIMLGGHHDTVYNSQGAVDDTSGTATVMELAYQFGKMSNEIGTPYYTIKVCTWGGEEEGLWGSKSFVDFHANELKENLVIYLNFDMPHVDIDLETRGNNIWFYGNQETDVEHIAGIVKKFQTERPETTNKYSITWGHLTSENIVENSCNSDHCPFVQNGNNIAGSYGSGSWEYHTYLDDMSRFNEESLSITGGVLGTYAAYLAWGEW